MLRTAGALGPTTRPFCGREGGSKAAARAEGAERSRGSHPSEASGADPDPRRRDETAMSARAKSPAAAMRPAPKARSGDGDRARAKRVVQTRIRAGGMRQR